MLTAGKFYFLKMVEKTPYGGFFEHESGQQLFINNHHLPKNAEVLHNYQIFVFEDADKEMTGTAEKPAVSLGQFGRLSVVEVNRVGAFLDWGLPKDLMVPFAEQFRPLSEGQAPVVFVYANKADGRVIASTKIEKFLKTESEDYKVGQPVQLLVLDKTDLGYKVIIENDVLGMIHFDDVKRSLKYGQPISGFIKNIRQDKKIDCSLVAPGEAGRDQLAQKILAQLNQNDGIITITDKSSPEIIARIFGVSKKQYKNALGKLYKEGVVKLDEKTVTLINQ